MRKWISGTFLFALGFAAPTFAQQQAAPIVGVTIAEAGDTAWVIVAAVLTLLMTLPGLVLFYAGQVRSKNALSVAISVLAIATSVSLLWIVCGYSLVFDVGTADLAAGSPILGGMDNFFLKNLAEIRTDTTVPESSYALFQMMPALLAPALILGSFVDRARFGWMFAFSLLWSLCVYIPAAHWLWSGNGWLADLGAHDYAGGIVIGTTAGVSALVVALMIKPRIGYRTAPMPPHATVLVMAGAALLWAGAFGLTGGWAFSASDDAASAILNTHIAASAAALTYGLIERFRAGKVTGIGFATGAVTGLAAIMPAAGYIGPLGAIMLGGIASLMGYSVRALVANRFALDDSLNVFAIFGVGGLVGALLFPIFVLPALGGSGFEDGVTLVNQMLAQAIAVGAVALWAAVVTLILGLGLTLIIPMRVTEGEEAEGLDHANHGEAAWEFGA